MSQVDLSTVQNNLGLLVGIFGNSGQVAIYTDLAGRLSRIAHKDEPWSWRYVQSVHKGSLEPSVKFAHAVEILVAEVDGLPAFVSETAPITVHARPGSVRANSIVLGSSKPCTNPRCTVNFIPVVPWQKYCPRCRDRKGKRL